MSSEANNNYMEGILKKAGELNPSAKARYFQLWVDPPVFSYYKNIGGQLIKTIRLQGPQDEVVLDPINPLSFSLNTKDRNWCLFVEKESERKAWYDMFSRACSIANSSFGTNRARTRKGHTIHLRVKVPKTIETEGLTYFHCVVEAEMGPNNVKSQNKHPPSFAFFLFKFYFSCLYLNALSFFLSLSLSHLSQIHAPSIFIYLFYL